MQKTNYHTHRGFRAAIITGALSLGSFCTVSGSVQVATFDDLDIALHPAGPAESYSGGGVYVNGEHLDPAGGFTSGGIHFSNSYNVDWSSWSGFAYSTTTDTTTSGFGNQYSSIAGSGADGSLTYGIVYLYEAPAITLSPGYSTPSSIYISNTTYAYLSMLEGDSFAKKFGGDSGDDPDWFRLDVFGYDSTDTVTGSTHLYLADYRFEDNSLNYILDDWTLLDLSPLGTEVATIGFQLTSSDVGDWGMNTPSYFAIDNLTVVPEPGVAALLCGALALLIAVRRKAGS